MSSFSDYLENKVLAHVFGGVAYTAPGTLYVGLFTAAPTDAGGGTEVSGGSYARKSMAFTVTGSQAVNTALNEFVTATADWGTITHAAVFDAASGGNMLAWCPLTNSRTVLNGDIFRVQASQLVINLT